MNFWTIDHLRDLTGGRLHAGGDAGRADVALAGVNTDSRSVMRGQVFVALRGERFDGHAFVGQAAAAGAGLIVVDCAEAVTATAGTPALVVEDTRKALGKMAAGYRDVLGRMGARVIAVCGSNGKTTTTRMIDAVLGGSMRGTAAQKSFNNDVGVPLTILGAAPGDRYLLCEVGSNAPGEIATLGAIVRPDIAVITSIGREHLQGFGDLAGVAREEGSIAGFVQREGVVIATGDAPELRLHIVGRLGTRLKLFGRASDAELRLASCEHISDARGMGLAFTTSDGAKWRLGLLGKHNAANALAAIAVGREFGLKDAAIAAALERARGPEMRLQVVEAGGVRIIDDAYNANPESMLAAIATFGEVSRRGGAARRVVVLGDMRELGASTEDSHREIGRAVGAAGVDLFVAIGESMRWAAEEARKSVRVEWMAGAGDADFALAAGMVRAGDCVLVKGSRGMRMERVAAAVKAKAEDESSKVKVQSSNVG